MKLSQITSNKRGFGLIQVLIAAGLMGMIALGFAQMTSNASKQKKHFELGLEVAGFSRLLNLNLADSQACENSFVLTNLTIPEEDEIDLSSIKDADGNDFILVDGVLPGLKLEVEKISIQREEGTNTNLVVSYKKIQESQFGVSSFTRKYPLFFAYSDVDVVTSCTTTNSSSTTEFIETTQTTCEDLGGTWIELEDGANQCSLTSEEMAEALADLINNYNTLEEEFNDFQETFNNYITNNVTNDELPDEGATLYICPNDPDIVGNCSVNAPSMGSSASYSYSSSCEGQVSSLDSCQSYQFVGCLSRMQMISGGYQNNSNYVVTEHESNRTQWTKYSVASKFTKACPER